MSLENFIVSSIRVPVSKRQYTTRKMSPRILRRGDACFARLLDLITLYALFFIDSSTYVSRSSRTQYIFLSLNLVYSALKLSTRAFFRSVISCMRLANLWETKKSIPLSKQTRHLFFVVPMYVFIKTNTSTNVHGGDSWLMEVTYADKNYTKHYSHKSLPRMKLHWALFAPGTCSFCIFPPGEVTSKSWSHELNKKWH